MDHLWKTGIPICNLAQTYICYYTVTTIDCHFYIYGSMIYIKLQTKKKSGPVLQIRVRWNSESVTVTNRVARDQFYTTRRYLFNPTPTTRSLYVTGN